MPHPDPDHPETGRFWTCGSIALGVLIGLWLVESVLNPFRSRPPSSKDSPPGTSLHLSLESGHASMDFERATDLLIDAVIQIESGGNPRKVGGVGERGLMQIRESTWREVTQRHFGNNIPFNRAFDPELNRRVGRLYLGDLQAFLYQHRDHWRADLRSLLLAAYNAGPERLRTAGFDLRNLPTSTQSYAARGAALHDWYLEQDAQVLHEVLKSAAPGTQNE